MEKSTVYIDESGDLGKGKGTRWFVITAVIVDKEREQEIRSIMNGIKSRLNARDIHLRKIKDYYKRLYIAKELENGNFTYINVIADTKKINLSPDVAYNYMCRFLIERVSWFLRDTERVGDIILSARGTSKDGELIEYIRNKLIPFENNEIAKGVFGKIMCKAANSWDMLQLADVCATTTFLAHEGNRWGFRTPCYFKVLQNHLYKNGDMVMSYGLKYFTDVTEEIMIDCPFIEEERASGTTSAD